MAFQREARLPMTGQVDNRTWDAIVVSFYAAIGELRPPRSAQAFPNRDYRVQPGQPSVHLYLPQGMFKALSTILDEVEMTPVDGVHGPASVRNIRWLQRQSGLEKTGILGKTEWDHLSRLYDLFILRVD